MNTIEEMIDLTIDYALFENDPPMLVPDVVQEWDERGIWQRERSPHSR